MIGLETFVQECCLPNQRNDYVIKCSDFHNDGWHGGYLEINGKKYCENFDQGFEMFDILPNIWYNPTGIIISLFDHLSKLTMWKKSGVWQS